METIDLLSATGKTSADITPMEHSVLCTDDISKVSVENIEEVCQTIRQAQQEHPASAIAVAPHAKGTNTAFELTTGPEQVPSNHRPITTTKFSVNCRRRRWWSWNNLRT